MKLAQDLVDVAPNVVDTTSSVVVHGPMLARTRAALV